MKNLSRRILPLMALVLLCSAMTVTAFATGETFKNHLHNCRTCSGSRHCSSTPFFYLIAVITRLAAKVRINCFLAGRGC